MFPVQLTSSRIGNFTRLIHTLLYVMTIHTYIHTYIHSAFTQAGSLEYCSGGENGGKKGQGGVGLAVKNPITHAAHPPEFISDRLLKITLELRDRAKAVTFFVANAPTATHNASNKDAS